MTQPYINGFLTKCAEYGVDGRQLLKTADRDTYIANYSPDFAVGALLGGAVGALTGKKGNRLKRALLGGLLGGSAGAGARYLLSGKTIREFSKYKDEANKKLYDRRSPVKDERIEFAADFTSSGKARRSAWAKTLKELVEKKGLIDGSRRRDDGSHEIITSGNEPWRKMEAKEREEAAVRYAEHKKAEKAYSDALKKYLGEEEFIRRFGDLRDVPAFMGWKGLDREAVKALMPEEYRKYVN